MGSIYEVNGTTGVTTPQSIRSVTTVQRDGVKATGLIYFGRPNRFEIGDTITINGVSLVCGTDWQMIGTIPSHFFNQSDAIATIQTLADAINAHPACGVTAVYSGSPYYIMNLVAITGGTAGNSITLAVDTPAPRSIPVDISFSISSFVTSTTMTGGITGISVSTGLIIFNTDTNLLNVWNGSAWQAPSMVSA
jgi:hypothetical protein